MDTHRREAKREKRGFWFGSSKSWKSPKAESRSKKEKKKKKKKRKRKIEKKKKGIKMMLRQKEEGEDKIKREFLPFSLDPKRERESERSVS